MNTPTSKKDILEKYTRLIGSAKPANLKKYGLNLVLAGREGIKVSDTTGKTYYDCFCSGGQQVLGNNRADIAEKFRETLKQFDIGNFILMSEQKASLAKLLADITPGNLKHTVYGVGRGEANDFAIKLARGATGRKEIICFKGASHGQTAFALTASDAPQQEELFGPLIPMVKRIPLNALALEQAVSHETAAVIIEPIQSDAGVIFPPVGLLKKARYLCDKNGAALILDEGQTSLGRTGLMFECQRSNITPDILTVAKGMGGSLYPITATVFNSRMNRFMLTHPLVHLSTFGGADIGCILSMATIDIIRKNELLQNAEKRGAQLLDGLKSIVAGKEKVFTEVRGKGLLIGVEANNASNAKKFSKALVANGVIALPAPTSPNVVRLMPPIDITKNEIDAILNAAEAAANF